jgi:hypothetical protein
VGGRENRTFKALSMRGAAVIAICNDLVSESGGGQTHRHTDTQTHRQTHGHTDTR